MTAGNDVVDLRLPAGWDLIPPDTAGASGLAALAARRAPAASGFTPTISLALHHDVDAEQVARVGSETVRRLDSRADDVRIRRREAIGSGRTEGLAQELRLTTMVDGHPLEVAQMLLVLVLAEGGSDRLMAWAITVTAAAEELPEVLPDVEALVASIGTGPAPRG